MRAPWTNGFTRARNGQDTCVLFYDAHRVDDARALDKAAPIVAPSNSLGWFSTATPVTDTASLAELLPLRMHLRANDAHSMRGQRWASWTNCWGALAEPPRRVPGARPRCAATANDSNVRTALVESSSWKTGNLWIPCTGADQVRVALAKGARHLSMGATELCPGKMATTLMPTSRADADMKTSNMALAGTTISRH